MAAQTTVSPAVGEYYLQGVMETASGFRLNDDSSFNFFFSYGALDREGGGNWKQQGNTIIFNSKKEPAQDYRLLQSKQQAGQGLTIQITEANEQLRKMIHAVIRSGTITEQASADDKGLIKFKAATADTISLLFEWCPEKEFVFAVKDTTHNFFEFAIEPSVMDILFNDFKLQLTETGFTGAHPMDRSKTFNYKKTTQKL